MEFEKINILDLLPQHPPFVMVDRLLYYDDITTTTSLTICEDNIFVESNEFTESGIIENIAQTCAARAGNISNEEAGNGGVKIGFIGMIRNLEIARLPKTGETLVTQVNLMDEVFQITLVNATVSIGDEIITSCEMKISITGIAI